MAQDFTELTAWKEAKTFRLSLMAIIKDFPKTEQYRLTDQMIRASRSVTNNIAEGHGRFHFQENIQFCRTSRGSLTELKDHLIIAVECEYISNEQFKDFMVQYEKCLKLLNGYINFLKSEKSKPQQRINTSTN